MKINVVFNMLGWSVVNCGKGYEVYFENCWKDWCDFGKVVVF